MTEPNALSDKLELFVFTYNRAKALRNLLGCFAASPFIGCSLTILDNCSTDGTPGVCEEYTEVFPRLKHLRHPKNIGGLANYLRAAELAKAEYCWILCDDDNYRFDQINDLVETLKTSSADLISVGVEGHKIPGGYRGSVRELAEKHPFILSHSLVPSLIFRTSLFTSECIRLGYDHAHTMFPQFPFLADLVRRNASIHVSREKIIVPGHNYGYSTFAFLRGWMQSAAATPEKEIRKLALRDVFSGRQFYLMIIYSFLTERTFRPKLYRKDFSLLLKNALICSPFNFLRLLFFSPLLFLPRFAHQRVWNAYSEYRRKQGKPVPNFDEMR
jgi:glycosyltransferase involved in cell wall biosynthesis